MYFEAKQASFPVAADAPYFSRRVDAGVVRMIDMVVFASASGDDEFVAFAGKMPQFYSDNGIDVFIHFTLSAPDGVNPIIWGAAFEKIDSSLLITSDGFASAKSDSVSAAAPIDAIKISTIEFANSEIDGLEAGNVFRVKIYREADDIVGASGFVHMIELREGL